MKHLYRQFQISRHVHNNGVPENHEISSSNDKLPPVPKPADPERVGLGLVDKIVKGIKARRAKRKVERMKGMTLDEMITMDTNERREAIRKEDARTAREKRRVERRAGVKGVMLDTFTAPGDEALSGFEKMRARQKANWERRQADWEARQNDRRSQREGNHIRREVAKNPQLLHAKVDELKKALQDTINLYRTNDQLRNDPKGLASIAREVLSRNHAVALDFLGKFGYEGEISSYEVAGKTYYVSFDEKGNAKFDYKNRDATES